MKLSFLLLLLVLSGCVNPQKLVTSMAKDNATVTLDVNTIYGHVHMTRTNPDKDHSATVNPNGTVDVKAK